MKQLAYPVILSGGAGTRLWPLSRRTFPKQFLPLTGPTALFQETAKRVSGEAIFAAPLIVCNEAHRFIIAEQLRTQEIEPMAIVLEPVARNTAPALAAAALMIAEQNPDGLMLVLPSDHVIKDIDAFRQGVETAMTAAGRGMLTTFGIIPESPETGFGYLKRGPELDGVPGAYHLLEFVEKPDLNRAETYLASGEYSWNSGMFVLPVRSFLEELSRLQPELLTAVTRAVATAQCDLNFTRLDESAFASAPSISVDHAVMEHTKSAAVVPVDIGWNDVGSWASLWNIGERDEGNNVTRGDVVLHDVDNCYVHSEKRLVAGVGIKDLVIVETQDAVLVADRNQAQKVKQVAAALEQSGRSETDAHTRVYRPWGDYEGISSGNRFQVKQITVTPGEKLSLQMHHHRAEHWVVVEGTAIVTKGDETVLLTENQSTYIPIGVTHRLENPGEIPLILIEVQSGSYLGEDDIVRFADRYGRDTDNTQGNEY